MAHDWRQYSIPDVDVRGLRRCETCGVVSMRLRSGRMCLVVQKDDYHVFEGACPATCDETHVLRVLSS